MKKLILSALLLSTSFMAHAEVVVGGKNFTEQLLLAEITTQLLNHHNIKAEKRDNMGSNVLREAQKNGQVDLYWEYTGTSLINYNKVKERKSTQESYDIVKELDAKLGLVWLDPAQANNTYALAMRSDDAKAQGISTISDLATKVNGGSKLTLASETEFFGRPDGLKPMQKEYGFKIPRKDVKLMAAGLVYSALKESKVDIGLVYTTDGRVPAFNFTVLEDDKGYFPSYSPAPVVRKEILDKEPKLADLLNKMSAALTNDSLAALNANVDVDKVSIEEAAATFLKSNGLI